MASETELDIDLLPDVLEIIEEFGKELTWTIKSTSTYNPATGETTFSSTDYIQKSSPPEAFKLGYADGDLVKLGDLSTILPAKGLEFTPSEGMSVKIDGTVFLTISVESLYSGEKIAAYKIQLRK